MAGSLFQFLAFGRPGGLLGHGEVLHGRVTTNRVLVYVAQLVGKLLQYFHSGFHVTCKYIMASR